MGATPRASSPGSARRPWSSWSGWGSAPSRSSATATRRSSRGLRAAHRGLARGRGRFEARPRSRSSATKSQSTEITFDVDVTDRAELAATFTSLAEELCRRLRSRELEGRTIGIKVRLDDWTNVTRSHTVEAATNDPELVAPTALDLLRAYSPPRPVRLLGVRLACFSKREPSPSRRGDGELPVGLQPRRGHNLLRRALRPYATIARAPID